jgi:hypothetical protein
MAADDHGSESTYGNWNCRCDGCRDAHARYNRKRRKERKAEIRQDPSLAVHGKRSTYLNWGCRCDACCGSEKAQQRIYRKGGQ